MSRQDAGAWVSPRARTGADAGGIDPRGFDWRLGPLQCKLAWALEAARVRSAKGLAEVRHAQQRSQALEADLAAQARRTASLGAAAIDPAARWQALAFLAGGQRALGRSLHACGEAEADLAEARQACLQARVRLESLQAAHDAAWARHAQAMRRREANEADAAWLARRTAKESQA